MPPTPPQPSKPQCSAVRTDGQPCRSFARTGRPFCIAHDPEHAEAMRAARVAGGKSRSAATVAPAPPVRLASIADQLGELERTIDRVRAGQESPHIARLVLYGISLARPLVELGELEERLKRLEERYAHP